MSSALQVWIAEAFIIIVIAAVACALYFHYQSGALQKQVSRLRKHVKAIINKTKQDNALWQTRFDDLDHQTKVLSKYKNLYRENKDRLAQTKQELAQLEEKVGSDFTQVNNSPSADTPSAELKRLQDKLQHTQRNLKASEDDYLNKTQQLHLAQEEIKRLKSELRAYRLEETNQTTSAKLTNQGR